MRENENERGEGMRMSHQQQHLNSKLDAKKRLKLSSLSLSSSPFFATRRPKLPIFGRRRSTTGQFFAPPIFLRKLFLLLKKRKKIFAKFFVTIEIVIFEGAAAALALASDSFLREMCSKMFANKLSMAGAASQTVR